MNNTDKNHMNYIYIYITSSNQIPLGPTVKDELLFQTGAPELVVQKGEL